MSLSAADSELPDDVVRLVIAAREIAYGDRGGRGDEDIEELDRAVEAFATRVPWSDDDEDDA